MSRWKKLRHRLECLGVALLARGIPRLPRRACVWLGNALGVIAYRVDRRGWAVALENLACVFGKTLPLAGRERIARASYRNFLRTMLDLFWSANLTPENWRTWIEPVGFGALKERLDRESRGAIFVCVHQGNWEWASLTFGFLGLPTTIVAENFKNPGLTASFNALRERTGHAIIPQENSLLRMLKIVKRRGATGMLIDLNLRPTQAATIVEAFGPDGLKMCVPVLHAVLAQRANALFVPVETQPRADGTCRVIAHPGVEIPASAALHEIAQHCWDACEPFVRARPEEWLWAYKHFRYAPKDATRAYPAYANHSAKFEKLLRSLSLQR
jgi:lauroyl/myristoyl acyltransferase